MEISNTNVLVVAAHPDDESIGMGATISKMSAANCSVTLLLMSSGVTSRDYFRESIEERKAAALRSSEILGIHNVLWCDFPDNEFDTIPQLTICKGIENVVKSINPTYIFTHSLKDLNVDHRRTAEACIVASRPKSINCVKGLFSFEISSSTDWNFGFDQFSPNLYVNVTDYVDFKEKSLKAYEIEMDTYPNSRSIKAILGKLQYRGNSVGCEAAEAFEIIMMR